MSGTNNRDEATTTQELLASEELNNRIIEALPGGIVHVAIDGAIQTANAEALRILGMSFDALSERYTQDFATETIWENGEPCPPEQYPVSRALMTGEPQPPETIGIRHPDGRVSWAIFTAVPVKSPSTQETTGAVVTFLDVTAHKETMHALQASEARLRSVVTSTPSSILTVAPDGTILFINRVTDPNLDVDDVVGGSVFDFVGYEHADTVQQCMDTVVSSGIVSGYEFSRRSDSREYSVRVGPVFADGEIVALSFVATDVTEVAALQKRVAISDRLASIGTLASGVAHEINNPLTYLMLSLDHLAMSPRTDASLREPIAAATDAAERIKNIVAELAGFGRGGSDVRGPVKLEAAIESAVKMSVTQIRYRARLIRDYQDTPPVMANDARLAQVFLNLLVNAAQSIEEGNLDTNSITIAIARKGENQATIAITDTGCGITAALLPRVFEPFITTKDVGEGTGLGLHICYNIVASFEGSIDVESTVGQGTTVTITLPLATASESRAETSLVSPAKHAEKLRILVVDDESGIRETVQILLAEHDVTLASSGREALKELREGVFDAIFCDLIMPDLTGMDVHQFIVNERPELEQKLIFMTGGAFTERAQSFIAQTSLPLLKKPFNFDELKTCVAKLKR